MTIATKAQLRAALGGADGFLHRTLTDARLDELILMGESRLNRELRLIDMITAQSGTLSTLAATLALPDRFAEKVQFRIDEPLTELVYVMPDRIRECAAATGLPRHYTVTDSIEFDAVPGSAYAYTLKFYRGYRLALDTDTNYVLTNYPQAYLYACGLEHGVHTRDFEQVQAMTSLLGAEIAAIKKAEARRKGASHALLSSEFHRGRAYNINEG